MNKDTLHVNFQHIYNGLNVQQQQAVNTIEGPVMVIAGPGTGKTQILSARVGKILLETDVLPENILCLTYTDAGTIAMRKRLQQFIGSDAYRVNISTFHAFCNDVIQDNLSLFQKNNLDPISELEKVELFKTLIDNFPKGHPLKRYRGDVHFEINNLQWLFSLMKKEGWTVNFLTQKINEYIESLPLRDEFIAKRTTKEFKKGDLRTDKIDDVKQRMQKLQAAVNEFENYTKLMLQKNRYDFDDMINWVISAFEQNSNLLATYQEKFLYIMVDEYQDTSGTQNKLVELLTNYWHTPNIFVVGDDDQSIYRFQGANVENMMVFANKFKNDLCKVVLQNNYRSVQPILNIAQQLIKHNKDRLINKLPGLTKELVAANTKINQLQIEPQLQVYKTQKQELIGITLQVEQLLQQGINPGKIAVLYRENKYGDTLTEYFKLKQISVYSKRDVNLLDDALAQKIITIFEYLAAELDIPYGGDGMLFHILHYQWLHLAPIEIAKLSIDVANKQFGDNKTSLRELLYQKAQSPEKELFSNTNTALQKVSGIIENLISTAANSTLQQLTEAIITTTGLLQYIQQHPQKHHYLKILTALFDFIKEETRRNPSITLQQFVEVISLMKTENIVLPLKEITGTDKGVNLLTIHGSKGLEFEYVFVAGCNSAVWEKKRKNNSFYKLPDNIFSTTLEADDNEELRRLFYVALTRAEKYLTISYAQFKDDGKELEPTQFIAEIQDGYNLVPQATLLPEEEQQQFQHLILNGIQQPEIEKIEEEFVSRLLEKFTMNVTALNNYLKCPLAFYYQNLVRIPSGKNEATVFGSAVHYALQRLFEKMQNNEHKNFSTATALVEDFNAYMQRNREHFTPQQYNRRIEYGVEVLTNYYNTYIHSFNKIVAIERNINNVVINGVPIKGKLDKIEFEGNAANVVDYKSGKFENAKAKLNAPNDKDNLGGDYWRQAVFYKLLVDNYATKNWQVVSTEFDFIEPDEKNEYRKVKLTITPTDVALVTQQITTVWQKIQERDFYTGCGKPECHWCNFVKNNELAVALHELDSTEDD